MTSRDTSALTELSFSSFQEVATRSRGRKIVLFGAAGGTAEKTVRKLRQAPAFFVDNNENMWGIKEVGFDVHRPDSLRNGKPSDYFVLICTTSFGDVGHQLVGMGFKPGIDFVVSPILNDLRIISELEAAEAKMLFTSGYPEDEDKRWGGGIYELELRGQEWEYRKLYSGTCYGIIPFEDGYVAVDDKRGMLRFDKNYKLVHHTDLKHGTRAHGISFSEKHGRFYVAASNLDAVLVFSPKLELVDSIPISHKFARDEKAAHHCNDICVVGDSAFVSMFSQTGNYKQGIFDGVVLEIDIPTKKVLGPAIRDLWMPHNISFIDGTLTVLDSLRGELKRENSIPVGRFPGFSRGLGSDGAYFYVGQSRNRNYSKYLGQSLNISIDTSIIVFDEKTKVSRSLSLPSRLSEIHSVLVID